MNVVVMRHGERMDARSPDEWRRTKDGKRYPYDAPLTEQGSRQAGEAARDLSHRFGHTFSLVVTSPYIRCIGTAVEVCRHLRLPLCIDQELGEVYGPMCFGACEDSRGPPRRSVAEVEALLPSDVQLVRIGKAKGIIGCPTAWPESLDNARLRLVGRVEQYAARAARVGGASCILVTHGDCVAACLTLALAGQRGATQGRLVDKVNYCGYASLERDVGYHNEADLGLMDEEADWTVNYSNLTVQKHGWAWGPEGHRSFDPRHLEAEAKALREQRQRSSQDGPESTTLVNSPSARSRSQQALGFQEYVGGTSHGDAEDSSKWDNIHDLYSDAFASPLNASPHQGAKGYSGMTPLLLSSHENLRVHFEDQGSREALPFPGQEEPQISPAKKFGL